MANKPRKLRRSQAISTFGPGSIIDLKDESVMMLGLDYWPDKGDIIQEPNLQRALRVNHFKSPSTDGYKDLPVVIFPEWLVCPSCNRLARLETFMGLFKDYNKISCLRCKKKVYPARLIVACSHGHIDDFPWIEWLRHASNPCKCEKPDLILYSSGFTATLADLVVKCKNDGCGKSRPLAGAMNPNNFLFMRCNGRRPWLLDRDDCDATVFPLQRGASNVYFSSQVSSISIPPWSGSLNKKLNKNWSIYKAMPESALMATVEGMGLHHELKMPLHDVVEAILTRRREEQNEQSSISELDIRLQECRAIQKTDAVRDLNADFKTRNSPVHPELQDWISRVVLVDRLREVRALIGFSRVDSPDPDPTQRISSRLAPLSRARKDWYPAIEVFGEGIFIELNQEKINRWLHNNNLMKIRSADLNKKYLDICQQRDWVPSRIISPQLLLAHSFSHALIRQLAMESGYSSSSIRERLYVFPQNAGDTDFRCTGFLLYTSTPDSEGSLGGLVRQGYTDNFMNTVRSAIVESSWCSRDPLCMENYEYDPGSLNQAACHSCMLISETSCEEFNRFLDRATLVGTIDDQYSGFFSDLIKE
ncbi:MAG: DUF1998 domain-containing protein [Anaerolineaceae bacterium]|nr:DUF1998 domain-containing protein [Anaerolineaceae bacterium]